MDERIKDFIETLYKKELNDKPTFSDDMQKHIQDELERMVREYHENHAHNKSTEN